MSRVCAACGAASGGAAKFCAACGESFDRRALEAERTAELAEARGVAGAVAIVFLGSLAAVVASSFLVSSPSSAWPFVCAPLLVGVGFLAARALGEGALRASVGGQPGALDLVLGLGGGGIAFAFSVSFVKLLVRWLPLPESTPDPSLVSFLGTAVLTPLAEEWLCRGVLWVALRRVLGAGTTTLITAALFAFLHGLNGLGPLEYPHRFALGLIAGALRARSGSLAPSLLAHATLNGLAVSALWT